MEEKELLEERQSLFDQMLTGLAKQGWRQSYFHNGKGCCYRGPEGLKCAVGHLIPDSLYEPEMDANGGDLDDVDNILRESVTIEAVLLSGKISRHYHFLISVQEWHDNHLVDMEISMEEDRWNLLKDKVSHHRVEVKDSTYYEEAARG